MIRTLFWSLPLIFCLSGCVMMEELDKESPVQEAKEYIVPIKMAGEILEIEEGPLTKAGENNDLYGFQINSKKAGEIPYSPYAYGLFDDISDVKVKLISGAEYEFICTMVRDGKNKISDNRSGVVSPNPYTYLLPFDMIISNAFVYDTNLSKEFSLTSGLSVLRGTFNDPLSIPNTDRYFGTINAISPQSPNVISINMKRVVFGLKCVVEGLIEGELNIKLKGEYNFGSPVISIIAGGDMSFEDVYTFGSFEEGTNGELSRTYTLEVKHIHADKTQEIIVEKPINFKRNKKTTVTVKVNSKDTSTKGVDIVLEDTPMTDGDKITIEGR